MGHILNFNSLENALRLFLGYEICYSILLNCSLSLVSLCLLFLYAFPICRKDKKKTGILKSIFYIF